MSLNDFVDRIRGGSPAKFPTEANTLAFAQQLDSQDSIRHLRDEFIIPTKASLRKTALDGRIPGSSTPLSSLLPYHPSLSSSGVMTHELLTPRRRHH